MKIYHETNKFLETCFHILEEPIPSPVPVRRAKKLVLRYNIKRPEIAILQKLARYISGLNAALLLLDYGYTQELGALFRTLDEFNEDIMFLSLPLVSDTQPSKNHDKYLEDFFQEEFNDPENAFLSTQKRNMVPRDKIRAFIANAGAKSLNPHDGQELYRTISQAYSGYVHGASGHICEMIDGSPLKYFLHGMKNTYRQNEFAYNYWDYSYRGLISTTMVAKVLGEAKVVEDCHKYIKHFESITGDTGTGDAEKEMKKMKKK